MGVQKSRFGPTRSPVWSCSQGGACLAWINCCAMVARKQTSWLKRTAEIRDVSWVSRNPVQKSRYCEEMWVSTISLIETPCHRHSRAGGNPVAVFY